MTLNFYVHKDDDAVECNIHCKQKYKDQIIKNQEKAEFWDNWQRFRDGTYEKKYNDEVSNALTHLKEIQEDAEKYKRVDDLFTELEIPLPYDLWLVQSLHIRERLEKFFNGDNVLTKSEYKQKILGGEYKIIDNPKWKTCCKDTGEDEWIIDKHIERGEEK